MFRPFKNVETEKLIRIYKMTKRVNDVDLILSSVSMTAGATCAIVNSIFSARQEMYEEIIKTALEYYCTNCLGIEIV